MKERKNYLTMDLLLDHAIILSLEPKVESSNQKYILPTYILMNQLHTNGQQRITHGGQPWMKSLMLS